MGKKYLQGTTMSTGSAYVDDAAEFARALVWADARGPGDYENAMNRVARRAGVSRGLLWRLRYRRPQSVAAADFEALGRAYNDCGLQQQERTRVEPKTAMGRWLIGAAAALDSAAATLDSAADALEGD